MPTPCAAAGLVAGPAAGPTISKATAPAALKINFRIAYLLSSLPTNASKKLSFQSILPPEQGFLRVEQADPRGASPCCVTAEGGCQ
jgi:hypothetical protein